MINVGDTVQYTAAFCKSIGAIAGSIPFSRGKVIDLSGSFATVDWFGADEPTRVNTHNLKRVTDWEPN